MVSVARFLHTIVGLRRPSPLAPSTDNSRLLTNVRALAHTTHRHGTHNTHRRASSRLVFIIGWCYLDNNNSNNNKNVYNIIVILCVCRVVFRDAAADRRAFCIPSTVISVFTYNTCMCVWLCACYYSFLIATALLIRTSTNSYTTHDNDYNIIIYYIYTMYLVVCKMCV